MLILGMFIGLFAGAFMGVFLMSLLFYSRAQEGSDNDEESRQNHSG